MCTNHGELNGPAEITETVLQVVLDSLRNLKTEDIIRNTPDPPTPRRGVLYMRGNKQIESV